MKKIRWLTFLFTLSCFVPIVSFYSSCGNTKEKQEEKKRKITLVGTNNADLTFTEDEKGITITYNLHYENLVVLYANVFIDGTKLEETEYKLDLVSNIKTIFIPADVLKNHPGDIVVDSKVEEKVVTNIEVKYNDKIHFQSKSIFLHNDIYIRRIFNDKTSDKNFLTFNKNCRLLINGQSIDNFYDNGYIFSDQNEKDGRVDFEVQYTKSNVVAPLTIPVAKLTNTFEGVELEKHSETECYIKLSDDAKRLTGQITIPEKLEINGKEKTVVGIAPNGFYSSQASSVSFTNEDNITKICRSAFGQSSFETFNIPKNVVSLASSAFNSCLKLTNLTFDDNSKISEIPMMCFFNCLSLQTITLPKQITKIYKRAFDGCVKLKSVHIQYEGTKKWKILNSDTFIDITDQSINANNLKNTLSDSQNNWGYTGIEESETQKE